jgi:hypothetical protein
MPALILMSYLGASCLIEINDGMRHAFYSHAAIGVFEYGHIKD